MKVEVIEEMGRKSVMRDFHKPMKIKSRGWKRHTLKSLIKAIKKGDDHGKSERLLLVSLEITAPRDVWHELETYTVGVIKGSSESTMYTLLKELDRARSDVDLVPLFHKDTPFNSIKTFFKIYLSLEGVSNKSKRTILKKALPEGFLQARTRVFTYQTLRRMYHQRKYHLLPWWNEFFSELIPQLKEKELILETWDLKDNHRNLLL